MNKVFRVDAGPIRTQISERVRAAAVVRRTCPRYAFACPQAINAANAGQRCLMAFEEAANNEESRTR